MVGGDEKVLAKYMAVGNAVEEFNFYHVSEELGKKAFPELKTIPCVVILRDFEEKQLIFSEPIEIEPLEKYLKDKRLPLVSEFNDESVSLIFQKAVKKGIILVIGPNTDAKIKEEYKKLATAKKSEKFIFTVANAKDDWGSRLLKFFGLEEKDLPILEVLEVTGGDAKRYKHTGEFTEQKMITFLDDFESGKIPRFLKTEEIPAENPGPVYRVVGKNFKSEVIDNDADVLVKFYAEWCGHCKQLAPIYVTVAESLKGNKGIKLVEIDATKNDIEGQAIHGFPTLKLFKSGEKTNPIDFTGDRTEEGIIKFLKEKCKNPVEIVKKDL